MAIVVGAILLYVSAAQIPASLGTGDDGFVGVTVDNTNQMLDIVTNMVDIIDEASNGILGQVDRLDELLTEYDIAEFDAEAIKDIIRAGTNATADFKVIGALSCPHGGLPTVRKRTAGATCCSAHERLAPVACRSHAPRC